MDFSNLNKPGGKETVVSWYLQNFEDLEISSSTIHPLIFFPACPFPFHLDKKPPKNYHNMSTNQTSWSPKYSDDPLLYSALWWEGVFNLIPNHVTPWNSVFSNFSQCKQSLFCENRLFLPAKDQLPRLQLSLKELHSGSVTAAMWGQSSLAAAPLTLCQACSSFPQHSRLTCCSCSFQPLPAAAWPSVPWKNL